MFRELFGNGFAVKAERLCSNRLAGTKYRNVGPWRRGKEIRDGEEKEMQKDKESKKKIKRGKRQE